MYLKLLRTKLKRLPKSGEISIYLSLVFTLIISLVLTVITGARGAALQVAFECAVESALLSAFGEYDRELLERYDVFFIDLSYLSNSPDPKNLEARLNEYFYDNFHPEDATNLLFYSDLIDVKDVNVSLSEYELATDRKGKPFARQVIKYMSNLIGIEEITKTTNLIAVWDSYDLNSEKFEEIRDELTDSISYSDEDTWEQTEIKDYFLSWMYPDYGVLGIMGTDYFKLSPRRIDPSYTLEKRTLEKGVGDLTEFSLNPSESIMLSEYALLKTGNYLEEKEDTKLKYETEYIIFGQGNDVMNMQCMVMTLFTVRTLADYISLNFASDKVEYVREAAEFVSTLTKIPEEIITQVVLFGWGELEAITDVRSLLGGESVPLIKTSDEINVSINGLINFLGDGIETSDGEESVSYEAGDIPSIKLDYKAYLRIFLYLLPSWIKTYRTMDIIEFNLRDSDTGNEFFRFDACVDRLKAAFSMESGFDFRFVSEKKYSYFE